MYKRLEGADVLDSLRLSLFGIQRTYLSFCLSNFDMDDMYAIASQSYQSILVIVYLFVWLIFNTHGLFELILNLISEILGYQWSRCDVCTCTRNQRSRIRSSIQNRRINHCPSKIVNFISIPCHHPRCISVIFVYLYVNRMKQAMIRIGKAVIPCEPFSSCKINPWQFIPQLGKHRDHQVM